MRILGFVAGIEQVHAVIGEENKGPVAVLRSDFLLYKIYRGVADHRPEAYQKGSSGYQCKAPAEKYRDDEEKYREKYPEWKRERQNGGNSRYLRVYQTGISGRYGAYAPQGVKAESQALSPLYH